MDASTFESARVAHFARHGFEGEGRWLTGAGDRRSYAYVRGGTGRPVVLVHGGLTQAGEWAQVAGLLSGELAVVDRPGWGLSDPAPLDPDTFRHLHSQWLSDTLDGLGFDEVTLVGASIGAYVCIAFAIDHPEKVHELITVGAIAGLGREVPLFARLLGNPVAGRLMARMKITDPEVNRKRVFANLVAHPERLPVDVLQDDVDAMSVPGAGREGFRLMHAMTTMRGFRAPVIIRDELPRLQTRTLVLWGDKDTFLPVAFGRDVTANMPQGQFELVDDAGHCIELEQPELVAGRITSFAAAG